MGNKRIYVLKRDKDKPAEVYHQEAFGGMGFGNMEWASFSERFDIVGMDEKTVTVQVKDETA